MMSSRWTPIAHWLKEHLYERDIPGLEWVDEAKGIFKVPWKHASRKSFCSLDGLIAEVNYVNVIVYYSVCMMPSEVFVLTAQSFSFTDLIK
jgi:Interferon regulatory factor transcription factor